MNRRTAAKIRYAIKAARHDWIQSHIYYGTGHFKGFTSFYGEVKDWDTSLTAATYKRTFRWMWNRYGELSRQNLQFS